MSGFALPAAVQRMVDAINAADTEAFVAAFTPEGFVSDWGTVKTGPEECGHGPHPTRSAPAHA